MQNPSFPTCASTDQAPSAIDIAAVPDSTCPPERDLINSIWAGQGEQAKEIEALARRYGAARGRRLHALSGHAVHGRELAEIYHAQFAQAATTTQSGPDFDRLEWQEALARAQNEADARHYADRWDVRRLVSRDACHDTEAPAVDDSPAMREWSARACRRGSLRRMVRHARECLVAHWSLSRSRTWRAALQDDLARLSTLARVARGASFGEFGAYEDFNSSAARRSFQRLAARMSSGDLLFTENPDCAQLAVDQWQTRRAWVATGDYMVATA